MWLQAVLIACAAPMLLAFVLTRNPYVILTALVLYSFLRGGADLNLLPLMTDLAGPHRSSTAVGLTNMANNLTGGLGVFLAGYLKAGFGLEGVFAGLTGILLIDAVMLYAGYRLFLREDLCAAA
jgi:predicted MFS family arabinose efflux permease